MSTEVIIEIVHILVEDLQVFHICISLGWIVFGIFCIWRKYDSRLNDEFIKNYRFLLRPTEYNGIPGSFYYLLGIAIVSLFTKPIIL